MEDIDYVVKNDTKGYFGAFSKTGKNSAEILTNIRQKDRLLNPQKYKGNNQSIGFGYQYPPMRFRLLESIRGKFRDILQEKCPYRRSRFWVPSRARDSVRLSSCTAPAKSLRA